MKKLGRFALIGVIVVMLVASLGLTGCSWFDEETEAEILSIPEGEEGFDFSEVLETNDVEETALFADELENQTDESEALSIPEEEESFDF